MTIFDVLTLIGGLCLFLFGMNVMGDADTQLIAELENTKIDEEREILFILAPLKTSKQIMEDVNREFGINSKANGIITAIPIKYNRVGLLPYSIIFYCFLSYLQAFLPHWRLFSHIPPVTHFHISFHHFFLILWKSLT